MYKMSWPDLACASAARVSSALLAVKRSIWTSTFSFAAHSWINASDVLLASGTKWSQKPIESLPAACAVFTNGAAIIVVVDAAAEAAMNRRRVNIFPFMVFAPFCARAAIPDSSRNRIFAAAFRAARTLGPRTQMLGIQDGRRYLHQTESLARTYERPALRKAFAALLADTKVACASFAVMATVVSTSDRLPPAAAASIAE